MRNQRKIWIVTSMVTEDDCRSLLDAGFSFDLLQDNRYEYYNCAEIERLIREDLFGNLKLNRSHYLRMEIKDPTQETWLALRFGQRAQHSTTIYD